MNISLSRYLLLAIITSVSVSRTFAGDVLNTSVVPSTNAQICSPSSTRGSTNQGSAVTLFNLTPTQQLYFEKFTVGINLSSNIVGDIIGVTTRNNNDKNNAPSGKCLTNTNHGAWTQEETAGWSTFWSSSIDAFGSFFGNVSLTASPIAVTDAVKMQEYIRRACGLNLIPDGKIGIKTLNAARICTPPCKGKCGRNTFESLKDNLFYDDAGKDKVYDGNAFTDQGVPTSVMYIDGSKLSTIPDGLEDYLILSGATVVAKDASSVGDMIEKRGLGLVKKNDAVELCTVTPTQATTINTNTTITDELVNLPIVKVNANLSCEVNTPQVNKDGKAVSAEEVKTIIKNALKGDPNNVITDDQIDKIPTGSSGFSPESAGECGLQGDGVITANGACQCDTNYKRIRTGDGEKCEVCDPVKCNCGLKLNTNMPFIGRCILYSKTNIIGDGKGSDPQTIAVNQLNAFPVLISGLVKILLILLGLLNFFMLIVGGVQMTIPESYADGFGKVKGVVIGLAVFGVLGVVLYLINPNFFT